MENVLLNFCRSFCCARMSELEDDEDLKSSEANYLVRVRLPLWAPIFASIVQW